MRRGNLTSAMAALLALVAASVTDVVGNLPARQSRGKSKPRPKFLGGPSYGVGNKAPSRRDRHRAGVAARRALSADKRRGCY